MLLCTHFKISCIRALIYLLDDEAQEHSNHAWTDVVQGVDYLIKNISIFSNTTLFDVRI